VAVHVVTPTSIRVPLEIAQEVARTAIQSDGVLVASESGLVALKLFQRSRQDEADILALVKTGRVDLSRFPLSAEKLLAFWGWQRLPRTIRIHPDRPRAPA
jgi:hypothetical protein